MLAHTYGEPQRLDAPSASATTVAFLSRSCLGILRRMSDQRDDDLAFSIAFALSRCKGLLRAVPRYDSIPHLMPVARAVIQQIERTGWKLTKTPPREPHSTHCSTGLPERLDQTYGEQG